MDKHKSIELVRKAAVERQALEACRILQALSNAIEHLKAELGFPGHLSVRRKHEESASGIVEAALYSFVACSPLDMRQCVVEAIEGGDDLNRDDIDDLVDLVRSDCAVMFGGKDEG